MLIVVGSRPKGDITVLVIDHINVLLQGGWLLLLLLLLRRHHRIDLRSTYSSCRCSWFLPFRPSWGTRMLFLATLWWG
jgi:hypothetical protein